MERTRIVPTHVSSCDGDCHVIVTKWETFWLMIAGRSTTSALDIWKERDPTDEELGSVSTIQSAWKGFYTRAIIASREIGEQVFGLFVRLGS